jgi:enediyne biosynthesis protein E4
MRSPNRSVAESLVLGLTMITLAGCGPKPGPTPTLSGGSPAPSSKSPNAPTSSDSVQFVDITSEAGIHWSHFSGARGKKYMPECETPGCAFIDFNNDQRPDILLLNGADWPERKTARSLARTALYRNDGDRFTDVTKGSGLDVEMHTMGVAVGDYDNDGDDDLYITCIMGPSRLFRNDGSGHFSDVTQQAQVNNEGKWGSSAAWLDYDRDGRLDLVVGNYCIWTPQTDVFCSVYKGKKSYCTPNVYDGDSVRLYHNEGISGFKDVSQTAEVINRAGKTWGIAILDFDDDGWPDICLANDMEPNCLFHNQKNGTFKEIGMVAGVAMGENGTAKAGMGIDAADIDHSGRPSILIGNFSGEGVSLFLNMGGSQFIESSHAWDVAEVSLLRLGWGLFFFDYDLDGWTDALVANGHLYENVQNFQPDVTYKEAPLLFRNLGGAFKDVAATHGNDLVKPMVARGAAYADIDGDGDQDVLLMELDGKPRLLRNEGGSDNNWVRVRTEGSKSNRSGLGAKVVVEAGGFKQTQWVRSGSSFLSASEQTLTFGLGKTAKVDRLTITWPSGKVETHDSVPVKQVFTAKEGA